MQDRHFIALGASNMFIAVASGAFGAHALKQIINSEMLAIWQTAVQYHMFHALALIAVGLLYPRYGATLMKRVGIAFLIGIVVFSGSLYLLALSGLKILGAITPIGGVAMLGGWAMLAWTALATKK
jgi:uncharacterized membrane protein YgdD (TMEM256/DUF423 family)